MKISDIVRAVRNLVTNMPRKFWIFLQVVGIAVLLFTVYLVLRPTTSPMRAIQDGESAAGPLGNSSEKVMPSKSTEPAPADSKPDSKAPDSKTAESKPATKVPPRLLDFLVGAFLASFILAGFISLNRRDLNWKAPEVFLVGSVIAVLAIALIIGTFHLSDDEPGNKTVFLISASFVAICAVVLAVCYVPRVIRALQGMRSTFLKITTLLCFAGAAGGLASHVYNNEGSLVLPDVYVVDKERAAPPRASMPTNPSRPQEISAIRSPAPAESKTPNEKIKRRTFHIGFLGDILVGVITANALHLAIASLVKYDAKDQDRPSQYFTFLALGIIAGFAGPRYIYDEAEKLKRSEVREIVRDEVDQSPIGGNVTTETSVPLPRAVDTSKAVMEVLARFEWPNEAEFRLMTDFAGSLKETKKPIEKFSIEELIAAAGSDLFVNNGSATSTTVKKYVTLVLDQPNTPRAQVWAAKILRGLSVTFEGTRSSRVGWYSDAQTDLNQLFFDATTSEQRTAGGLFANFAAFAAIIGGEPEQPEQQGIVRRLEFASSGAKGRMRNAIGLAKEVARYLKISGSSSPTPTPAPTSSPALGSPSPAPSPATVRQVGGTVEDRAALLRLTTTMRAVPKEVLETIAKTTDIDKAAISPFIESAPNYPGTARTPSSAGKSPTPTPTPSPTASASPIDSPSPEG